MAQTALDVVNRAIGRCSGEALDTLDDSTPLGEFAVAEYPQVRDDLLARHRWVFASKIERLTQRTSPPEDPRSYAYVRPIELVGAIHAFRDGAGEAACVVDAWQLADYIAADTDQLWAEFTGRTPEAAWPPWFQSLVVVAFAVPVARRLGKASLAAALQVEAFGNPELNGEGGLFLAAKQADAMNAPQRVLGYRDPGPLVDARFCGSTSGWIAGRPAWKWGG